MRAMVQVTFLAACLIVPGLSRAEAHATPLTMQGYQEGANHERQEERRQGRTDWKEAKRQLDSARAILNRVRPRRGEDMSAESLEHLKTQFADLYNDFNQRNGKAAGRERRDWQQDYAQIQRVLDDLRVPERREGSIGTSGHRDEDRGRHQDDLSRFREHLDDFYNAAAGHQWQR